MRGKNVPYLNLGHPMVLAHRGDSLHAPANTFQAFQRAVNQGADALETDAHWTKDGVIVLCHDDTVDATSNGHGPIQDFTYEELCQLDFGYWFTTDGGNSYPYRGKGVTIPSFKSVLETFPQIRVNVDIKNSKPHSLRQFVDEVYRYGAEHRVLAASFHDSVLKQFRSMNGEIATSSSTRETALFCMHVWCWLPAPKEVPYGALQVPVKHKGIPVISPRFVQLAHKAGLKVHVWTIDHADEMVRLLEMGVDGIVSNDPALAVQVRDDFIKTVSR